MTAVGRSRWMTFLLYGSITVLAVVWLVPMLSALATATLPLSQTRAGISFNTTVIFPRSTVSVVVPARTSPPLQITQDFI